MIMKFNLNISVFFAVLMSIMIMACERPAEPQDLETPDENTETPTEPDKEGEEEGGQNGEGQDPVGSLELDGYAVFFQDRTSWGATHIYGWNNDDGSVTNAWPGNAVTGTVDINDVTYKYVDMGQSLTDKTMKLIFNCNSSQNTQDGYEVTMNRHYYFRVTDDSAEEVDPFLSEEAGDEFALNVTSAQFESLPTSGKALTLSAKNYDWTIDLGETDWICILDDDGRQVTSGTKSDKVQYLTLHAAPNGTQEDREAKFTVASSDGSQNVEVTVAQSAAKAPFLSQWVFRDNKNTYSVSWPQMQVVGATDGSAGLITVVRGEANADVPFTCKVVGNNPNVSTMVEGDYWLYTFDADISAGSVIAFNATMAGDKKAPKYFIVEYFDGGEWKSTAEDLLTASEDASVKYTYKLSGEVSTGSPDTYQYTTVMQTCRFESAADKVQIRCRAVGNMTCDGGTQDINATSSSACSLPDFGFTASDVQLYPSVTPSQTKKVLILGNSFHYYFNPMFMLREIAWAEGVDLKIAAHVKGSQTFEKHLQLSNSLEAIRQGGYDYAIIQDQSKNPARLADDPVAYAKVRENCVALADMIRQYSPDCDVILDLTWAYPNSDNSYGGYGSYENFDKLLYDGAMEMALAAGCRIAPVGMAFAQSRAEHSGWSLYFSGDGLHQTRTGAYLEACVEYVTMFEKEFSGPAVDCNVSAERASYMRDLAESIVFNNRDVVYPVPGSGDDDNEDDIVPVNTWTISVGSSNVEMTKVSDGVYAADVSATAGDSWKILTPDASYGAEAEGCSAFAGELSSSASASAAFGFTGTYKVTVTDKGNGTVGYSLVCNDVSLRLGNNFDNAATQWSYGSSTYDFENIADNTYKVSFKTTRGKYWAIYTLENRKYGIANGTPLIEGNLTRESSDGSARLLLAGNFCIIATLVDGGTISCKLEVEKNINDALFRLTGSFSSNASYNDSAAYEFTNIADNTYEYTITAEAGTTWKVHSSPFATLCHQNDGSTATSGELHTKWSGSGIFEESGTYRITLTIGLGSAPFLTFGCVKQ